MRPYGLLILFEPANAARMSIMSRATYTCGYTTIYAQTSLPPTRRSESRAKDSCFPEVVIVMHQAKRVKEMLKIKPKDAFQVRSGLRLAE